jgi:hypothetical protein
MMHPDIARLYASQTPRRTPATVYDLTELATWEEGMHPRDHGKFASKEGGDGESESKDDHEATATEAARMFHSMKGVSFAHLDAMTKRVRALPRAALDSLAMSIELDQKQTARMKDKKLIGVIVARLERRWGSLNQLGSGQ